MSQRGQSASVTGRQSPAGDSDLTTARVYKERTLPMNCVSLTFWKNSVLKAERSSECGWPSKTVVIDVQGWVWEFLVQSAYCVKMKELDHIFERYIRYDNLTCIWYQLNNSLVKNVITTVYISDYHMTLTQCSKQNPQGMAWKRTVIHRGNGSGKDSAKICFWPSQ